MKLLKVLDQYYIPTRYANAFASGPAKRYFTEFQAKQAIEFAEAILNEVKKIVFERRSLSGFYKVKKLKAYRLLSK
ncbi:HEPN domain-containing protein [Candidatus Bathyarchaeota archaeon]|nr:HEPN domain-containing protein [Candidatus Bathyarchaeota archaeon]